MPVNYLIVDFSEDAAIKVFGAYGNTSEYKQRVDAVKAALEESVAHPVEASPAAAVADDEAPPAPVVGVAATPPSHAAAKATIFDDAEDEDPL